MRASPLALDQISTVGRDSETIGVADRPIYNLKDGGSPALESNSKVIRSRIQMKIRQSMCIFDKSRDPLDFGILGGETRFTFSKRLPQSSLRFFYRAS